MAILFGFLLGGVLMVWVGPAGPLVVLALACAFSGLIRMISRRRMGHNRPQYPSGRAPSMEDLKEADRRRADWARPPL